MISTSTGSTAASAPRWPRRSITYRGRSAIRDVGKALGLSHDTVGALAEHGRGAGRRAALGDKRGREAGLDPADPRLDTTLRLANELHRLSRAISRSTSAASSSPADRLDELVPIENAAMEDRTVIEWDKDDLDALGILKVDVLALGMLTCLRKCFDLLREHYGDADRRCARRSPEDTTTVYDMICRADTLGVFQIESRAQMSMLPRLKPREFYDLVIEVAIVRPGPDPGRHGPSLSAAPAMARRSRTIRHHAGTARRRAENVLHKTLGVPLFQEQAMRIAIVAAGFTPGEADQLRRAMATFRRVGTIGNFASETDRRHGRARLRARIRRALLQADRGLRRVRLSRKPCRELRAPGLCLVLAEVPTIRTSSPPRCSTPSRWASMRRPSSCAMRASMASRCGRPTSTIPTGIARWSRARRPATGCMRAMPA